MSKKPTATEEKHFLKIADQQWNNTTSTMSNFYNNNGTLVSFSSSSEPTPLASILAVAKTPYPEQELTPFSPYPNAQSPYSLGLTYNQLQNRLREYCCQIREGVKQGRPCNIIVQLNKGFQLSNGYKDLLGDTVVKILPMGADNPNYFFIKAGDTLDTAVFLGDDLVTGIMLVRDDNGNDYYLRLSEFHLLTLRDSPNSHKKLALITSFIWAAARVSSSVVSGSTLDPIKMLLLSEWFKASWQRAKDAATEPSNNAIGGERNG